MSSDNGNGSAEFDNLETKKEQSPTLVTGVRVEQAEKPAAAVGTLVNEKTPRFS